MSPPTASTCTFDGTVASIRLRGVGPAVLTRTEAFSDGRAARVELHTARIRTTTPPHNAIERPAKLEPLDVNPDGAPYDATYHAGAPVVVRIDAGGAPGKFRGVLPGEPDCASAWCTVNWLGETKTITLHRADGEPVALTEEFPYGELDPNQKPRLDLVVLEGAEGTLACTGKKTEIRGETLRFTGSEHASLAVAPITVDTNGLHVHVGDERGPWRLTHIACTAVTVIAVLAVAVLAWRWRRRTTASPHRVPPPPSRPPDDAPTYAPSGVASSQPAMSPAPPPAAAPAPALPSPPLPALLLAKLAPLRARLHAGPNAVLPIVGSGLSRGLPSWTALLEQLIAEVRSDADREELTQGLKLGKYLEVAGYLEARLHRARVSDAIAQTYKRPRAPRPPAFDLIARLPVTHVATTNYDPWLKNALGARLGETPQVYVPHDPGAFGDLSPGAPPLVLMLHGDADRPETCVLSEAGYRGLTHFPAYRKALAALVATRSLLFVGHSLTDPDLRLVLDEWQEVFGTGGATRHWFLGAGVTALAEQGLLDRGVMPIAYGEAGDHSLLGPVLEHLAMPPGAAP